MNNTYIVYGAGGFGREVAWLIDRLVESFGDGQPSGVVAFADDSEKKGAGLRGVPILPIDAAIKCYPAAGVVITVGDGSARRKMAERVKGLGAQCPSIIDPRAELDRDTVKMGDGCIVCAGSTLTVDITLGNQVHINLDCTIGHDAVLEDFVTLAPGVHVSGCVRIEEGAYIGTGASIINGSRDKHLVVGRGAVVGAQACVVRDVPNGVTVVGVPAKPREGR